MILEKIKNKETLRGVLEILRDLDRGKKLDQKKYKKIVYRSVAGIDGVISKNELLQVYEYLKKNDPEKIPKDPELRKKIILKPMRTQSGVTPVTVLTKPFPCPGTCIFCPNDIRMPKSYLPDEPGAQRATRNNFDPYLQTFDRLRAIKNIGHSVGKVELIILGGTWSVYPERYQKWFIKRCFQAMNDFGQGIDRTGEIEYNGFDEEKMKQVDMIGHVIRNSKPGEVSYNQLIADINRENNEKYRHVEQEEWENLEKEHEKNVNSNCRCVGLVIETRPDVISHEEIIRIRRLGCTKVQIGIQSLQDEVLKLNKRGHGIKETEFAFEIMRLAGFKIHGHWMANLYGSSPEADKEDYLKLFKDKYYRPDELKIYPCSLLETAELMDYYADKRWKPYTENELVDVVSFAIANTPQYCRLTRVIRDIPSTDIVVGNKKTNLREMAEKRVDEMGWKRHDIRSREIKSETVTFEEMELKMEEFTTVVSDEMFLQFVTKKDNKICGFLRLSLPHSTKNNGKHPFLDELNGCAMIREVHVYGNVVDVGKNEEGKAQHLGLGTILIEKAKKIAKENNFEKLAVISAIGTRDYYTKRGFILDKMYQICDLKEDK